MSIFKIIFSIIIFHCLSFKDSKEKHQSWTLCALNETTTFADTTYKQNHIQEPGMFL